MPVEEYYARLGIEEEISKRLIVVKNHLHICSYSSNGTNVGGRPSS
jgi:hypothetical protein